MLPRRFTRAFKTSTTYPFQCLIFHLWRTRVPTVSGQVFHPTRELTRPYSRRRQRAVLPRRESRVEVPPWAPTLRTQEQQWRDLKDPVITPTPPVWPHLVLVWLLALPAPHHDRSCRCPIGQSTVKAKMATPRSHPAADAKWIAEVRG
ncbi:hypothetical protein H5410_057507 [Solanum commersonii]|uniref:Uncharacterized protein n=1 Tax=Solanum commersonii TaxID=4109 RepID=A0A9J5WPX7_SOLCO|nr:hypothetical protein H5410_057507 [Solanum commersonii]